MTAKEAAEQGYKCVPNTDGIIMVNKSGDVISFEYAGIIKPYARKIPVHYGWDDYPRVAYRVHGVEVRKLVHRLVAETFIPNEHNLPEVNHKDENHRNCSSDNLEWCDRIYNENYGTALKRGAETRKKYVSQYTKQNELVGVYKGVVKAQQITKTNHISNVCMDDKERRTANGFLWKFEKGSFPDNVKTITVEQDGYFVCEVKQEYAERIGIAV